MEPSTLGRRPSARRSWRRSRRSPDVNYQPVRNSFSEDHVVVELLVMGTLRVGSKVRFHACAILTLRDGLIAAKRSYRKVVE
jgi:hypothetical protein